MNADIYYDRLLSYKEITTEGLKDGYERVFIEDFLQVELEIIPHFGNCFSLKLYGKENHVNLCEPRNLTLSIGLVLNIINHIFCPDLREDGVSFKTFQDKIAERVCTLVFDMPEGQPWKMECVGFGCHKAGRYVLTETLLSGTGSKGNLWDYWGDE